MSGRSTSKWIYSSTNDASYLYCENCKKKISAKDVIFADKPYTQCPGCGKRMENVDDDVISKLEDSIV